MDDVDRKILAELQRDGRLTLTELAERVRLSLSPCHRRLRALGKSMTWGGAPASESEQAAWVEALGWLADWRFPLLVLGESPPEWRSAR